MFIREDGKIKSDSKEEENVMPLLEGNNDVQYFIDDEIIVIRHALSVQIKKDEKQ